MWVACLQGQVIMVTDARDGGPFYIIKYEDNSEDEVDYETLLHRLLCSGPSPFTKGTHKNSGLVALQALRVEAEPFGAMDNTATAHQSHARCKSGSKRIKNTSTHRKSQR